MSGPRGFRRCWNLRQTYRKCHARLAELDLEGLSDIREVCARLGGKRGRTIQLLPVTLDSAHPSGFWISVADVDLILYAANTSKTHQEHIIAHELAHLICRHRGALADDEQTRLLFPQLTPALVRDMLRRTGYSDAQEREAEVMATLMLLRIEPRQAGTAEGAAVVRHIRDSLG